MALESTDDLKDMPHIVVVKTKTSAELFEYDGPGCMEDAHAEAQMIALQRPDAQVLVAMRYRTITGPKCL